VAGPFSGFPPDAIDFFKQLEKNNNREWFLSHKDVYERACQQPMKDLMAELEPRFGPSRISRIYRDLRFSANRSPYKTHIAAGVGGRYISLSREGLWVGAGMYKPEPAALRRFRAAIDDDAAGRQLANIVSSLRRKGYDVDTHDTVTSAPKGYRADHPRIDLLRMKDIFAGKAFPPAGWLSTRKAMDRIVTAMTDVEPLTKWLRIHLR
jgi:uncharacterized protein (TIGR02453 family)